MKKILFALTVVLFFATSVSANAGSSYTLGGTTYFTNDDGSTGNMYNLGGTTYYSDNKGNTGSAYNLGGTTYLHDNSGTNGTAYNLGNTTYYSDNNGTLGSMYNLGGTTYYNDNKGNTGSAYNLGGTTYTNFQQTPSYTAPVYTPVYVPVTPTLTIEQQCKKQYGTLSYANNSLCYCSQGSEWNTAQSQCIQSVTCLDGVRINNQCLTYTQDCQQTFGSNTHGIKSQTDNASSCYCDTGYQWNTNKTQCVQQTQALTCPANSSLVGDRCYCKSGMEWSDLLNKCIQSVQATPVTEPPAVTDGTQCPWRQDVTMSADQYCKVLRPNGALNPNTCACACAQGYTLNQTDNTCESTTQKKVDQVPATSSISGSNAPATKLSGYILLQVESHGEAWYVQPDTGKRSYMKDGAAAYEMMRSFGLGVSETDYKKIADGNTALLNKLRGKIILRPQAHGEAYYIHPKDLSVYYLQNGDEAYRIMRLYSLGITNTNLEKILMGDPLK